MKGFLFRLFVFTALLFALDRAFTLLKYKDNNLFAKIAEKKIESAYNRLVVESFQPDILFVGSSHCQFGVDPEVIDSVVGRKSYNLGFGYGADVGLQYSLLTGLLGKGKAPKLVVYAVDILTFDGLPDRDLSPLGPFALHMQLKSAEFAGSQKSESELALQRRVLLRSGIFRYSRNIPQYLRDVRRGKYLLPVFREQEFDLTMFSDYRGYSITAGGLSRGDGTLNPYYVRYKQSVFKPDTTSEQLFIRLIGELRERGCAVILIQVPESRYALQYDQKYVEFERYMNDLAERIGVKYINFDTPLNFPVKDDSLFFDTDHLNGAGARRFSGMVAEWLRGK